MNHDKVLGRLPPWLLQGTGSPGRAHARAGAQSALRCPTTGFPRLSMRPQDRCIHAALPDRGCHRRAQNTPSPVQSLPVQGHAARAPCGMSADMPESHCVPPTQDGRSRAQCMHLLCKHELEYISLPGSSCDGQPLGSSRTEAGHAVGQAVLCHHRQCICCLRLSLPALACCQILPHKTPATHR